MDACAIVEKYIRGTHGSLPSPDYNAMGALLTDEFLFTNEGESHNKDELLTVVFPGWSSIVDGKSSVRINAIAEDLRQDPNRAIGSAVVLANWETDYDVKAGSVWYQTDVDISGKQVRGFVVFAKFELLDCKINRIVQRSDTVVKTMGIEQQVIE